MYLPGQGMARLIESIFSYGAICHNTDHAGQPLQS
jgi:hypothetical protein